MNGDLVRATAAHAVVLAVMHRQAFAKAPWAAESFMTLLGQPGVAGLIDGRGGMVLWRVVVDEAEVLTIGVTAPRQGIGRQLLRAMIDAVGAAGTTAVHLEVAAGNVAARGLYGALGFVPAGVRRRYYPDGEDALLLRLAL